MENLHFFAAPFTPKISEAYLISFATPRPARTSRRERFLWPPDVSTLSHNNSGTASNRYSSPAPAIRTRACTNCFPPEDWQGGLGHIALAASTVRAAGPSSGEKRFRKVSTLWLGNRCTCLFLDVPPHIKSLPPPLREDTKFLCEPAARLNSFWHAHYRVYPAARGESM